MAISQDLQPLVLVDRRQTQLAVGQLLPTNRTHLTIEGDIDENGEKNNGGIESDKILEHRDLLLFVVNLQNLIGRRLTQSLRILPCKFLNPLQQGAQSHILPT
jgi:hypothetical protein